MKTLVTLLMLCATPGWTQTLIPRATGDAALVAALDQPEQIVDTVATWGVDWDGRPPMDMLVQAAYASVFGGNSVSLEYRIATPTGDGYALGATFELPGSGIKEVQSHPMGVMLVQYQYRDGDPRCCPSGEVSTILARPTP